MKHAIPSEAGHILQTLTGAGYKAYLVGGCVRDLLRGVTPHDWDVCTSARPDQTEACFADRRVIKTGLKHGTVTVLGEGAPYEITTFRAEGPYSDRRRPDYVRFVPDLTQDLARRDFTMNAIAMDLDGEIHDPFDGTEDIRAGRIRCVGDPVRRFREDGLRVMRALRFAAVLGYEIEETAAQAIHDNRTVLECVAAERVRAELCGLLVGRGAGAILRQYPDVLCQFWPELGPLVALEQNNPRHCWDGWEHTIRAVEAAPRQVTLRLTMLLHDVGKPGCKSTDGRGVDHFHGHSAVGAELAERMLERLRFDNAARKRVVTLVKCHDLPLRPEERNIRRWLSRLGPETFFLLLEVKRADSMGQARERRGDSLAELDEIKAGAERILAEGQCLTLGDLAVGGQDVIAAGVTPGPEVGRVLRLLLERVLSGEIPNQRTALLRLIGQERLEGS